MKKTDVARAKAQAEFNQIVIAASEDIPRTFAGLPEIQQPIDANVIRCGGLIL